MMRRFFRWYWGHVKSALSFGGYPHPLRVPKDQFWQAEWRSAKSFLIVSLVPKAIFVVLILIAVAVSLLIGG